MGGLSVGDLFEIVDDNAPTLEPRRQPALKQLDSDVDAVLWALGGYSYAENREEFCLQHRLHPRSMDEAFELSQQLARIVKMRVDLPKLGLDIELPLKPKPPSKNVARLVRESVIEGLMDHIACLHDDKTHYNCADLEQEPVYIHTSSCTYKIRPRPMMVAYNQIITTTKHCIREAVAIDPMFLARMNNCPLIVKGDLLQTPAPRYLKDKDQVVGFLRPKYTPMDAELPCVETTIPTDNVVGYRTFARAFLDGDVCPKLAEFFPMLVARPTTLLTNATQARVIELVNAFWNQKVNSKKKLMDVWENDPNFLLDSYLKWIPGAKHNAVRGVWPPVN